MSSNSVFFGYPIEHKDGVGWLFSDTLEPTITTHMNRPCGCCGLFRGEDDHDPCINNLPNTLNACCGHGVTECCYIMLGDGKCFYGEDARVIITNLKEMRVVMQNKLYEDLKFCWKAGYKLNQIKEYCNTTLSIDELQTEFKIMWENELQAWKRINALEELGVEDQCNGFY